MKFSTGSFLFTFLLSTGTFCVSGENEGGMRKRARNDEDTVEWNVQEKKTEKRGLSQFERALRHGKCGECPFDVFYHFERLNNGFFRRAIFQSPGGCVLAAIRDEESRRGAQYAIPPGEIALTQGYFEIEDYIKMCRFENAKTLEGTVTECGGGDNRYGYYYNSVTPYNNFFTNYEDSDVPSDPSLWVNATYPVPAGAIFAGIGADGLLRPVTQTSSDRDNFGYTGAVYECCPDIDDVCEIDPN